VGIITRGDVLRLYARSDETIVAAVRDSLQAADGIVVEAVEQGVVRLAGTAESQAMASAVVRIAEAADGVVAADADRLEWSESPQLITPIP
jgi:osmotically-inducible protein OsmY